MVGFFISGETMKRLMVVDAQNQFIRSYIVDPSLSSNGHHIGGCKGFLKILNKLTREIKPDAICVVWDGRGGSRKRRTINKNYKLGRKPPRRLNRSSQPLDPEKELENRIWQQSKLIEMLNEIPVMQFMKDSIEADDIISHVVQSSKFEDWQKVIVSSDKDFIQLLNERTILYRPTQSEVLNSKRVVEKYGIHPSNFCVARSIVGDKSDNLDGVKGIGLTTLKNKMPFLAKDNPVLLEDVFDICEENKEDSRSYEKILESKRNIFQNYKIMQLINPMISATIKIEVDQTIEEWEPEFNKTELRRLMMTEGFGEISLNDLYACCNNAVSVFNKQ